jgi:peptidoglycan/LPS O-acetylase OafA/YrhL
MNEIAASGPRPAVGDGLSLATPAAAAGIRTRVVDHLRAFITVLVVMHHALLAYHPYAPPSSGSFAAPPMLWRAFPVIDAARMPGADGLVALNDTFFMALMFLVGGLFVQRSLDARGAAGYVRERALRLGVPFVVCAAFLAPLAYYPAYLQSGGVPGLAGYWDAWSSLGVWPAGPAWFLWVLFAFATLAALARLVFPRLGDALARTWGALGERPARFWFALTLASVAVYVPVAWAVDPMDWTAWGPFAIQTARTLLYALYFTVGMGVGAYGTDRGLFAADGKLARRWALWNGVAITLFIVLIALVIAIFVAMGKGEAPGLALLTSTNIAFCAASAALGLMTIAFFARFAPRWTGGAWASLDRSAYGIYLVHYVFVAWVQYALLDAALPGVAKAGLAFGGALALSWGATALLRRIPAVARAIG